MANNMPKELMMITIVWFGIPTSLRSLSQLPAEPTADVIVVELRSEDAWEANSQVDRALRSGRLQSVADGRSSRHVRGMAGVADLEPEPTVAALKST